MNFLPLRSLSKSGSGAAAVSALVAFSILIIIAHVSTPLSSGPLGILIVFTLIYVLFTALAFIAVRILSVLIAKLTHKPALSARRRYYVSSVIGFLPVLYLTLLSMGGANIWGVGLVILFTVLMLFYVIRRSA